MNKSFILLGILISSPLVMASSDQSFILTQDVLTEKEERSMLSIFGEVWCWKYQIRLPVYIAGSEIIESTTKAVNSGFFPKIEEVSVLKILPSPFYRLDKNSASQIGNAFEAVANNCFIKKVVADVLQNEVIDALWNLTNEHKFDDLKLLFIKGCDIWENNSKKLLDIVKNTNLDRLIICGNDATGRINQDAIECYSSIAPKEPYTSISVTCELPEYNRVYTGSFIDCLIEKAYEIRTDNFPNTSSLNFGEIRFIHADKYTGKLSFIFSNHLNVDAR